jgi:hypothetical protein
MLEHQSDLVVVADLTKQLDRPPVVAGGLVVIAEVVVDVAEAVGGVGPTEPVADLAQQLDGTLAAAACLFVLVQYTCGTGNQNNDVWFFAPPISKPLTISFPDYP